MATLKEKSEAILAEKESKIIPENIKSGVTIFDVTGTYNNQIDLVCDAIINGTVIDTDNYNKFIQLAYSLDMTINPSYDLHISETDFNKLMTFGNKYNNYWAGPYVNYGGGALIQPDMGGMINFVDGGGMTRLIFHYCNGSLVDDQYVCTYDSNQSWSLEMGEESLTRENFKHYIGMANRFYKPITHFYIQTGLDLTDETMLNDFKDYLQIYFNTFGISIFRAKN